MVLLLTYSRLLLLNPVSDVTWHAKCFITSAKEAMYLSTYVRLFVRQQDYAKSFQAIFVKFCTIVDNCYGNNPLHFGLILTGFHFGFMVHDSTFEVPGDNCAL